MADERVKNMFKLCETKSINNNKKHQSYEISLPLFMSGVGRMGMGGGRL